MSVNNIMYTSNKCKTCRYCIKEMLNLQSTICKYVFQGGENLNICKFRDMKFMCSCSTALNAKDVSMCSCLLANCMDVFDEMPEKDVFGY